MSKYEIVRVFSWIVLGGSVVIDPSSSIWMRLFTLLIIVFLALGLGWKLA